MSGDESKARLRAFLTDRGAFEVGHTGRMLGDHLMATYDILRAAGCPEHVCLGGGLHSVYGTNAFRRATILPDERAAVQSAFGYEAEGLAYLFSVLDRPLGLESGAPVRYRTKEPVPLLPEQLVALRLIEAANLIEQEEALDRFPVIAKVWLDQDQRSR